MIHLGSLWLDAREVLAAVGVVALVALMMMILLGGLIFYWIVSADKGGKGTP